MSTPVPGGDFSDDDFTNPVSGEHHGAVTTVQEGPEEIRVTVDFIGGIGLYKLALGIDDEDSQFVSAALQVQLAGIVGP